MQHQIIEPDSFCRLNMKKKAAILLLLPAISIFSNPLACVLVLSMPVSCWYRRDLGAFHWSSEPHIAEFSALLVWMNRIPLKNEKTALTPQSSRWANWNPQPFVRPLWCRCCRTHIACDLLACDWNVKCQLLQSSSVISYPSWLRGWNWEFASPFWRQLTKTTFCSGFLHHNTQTAPAQLPLKSLVLPRRTINAWWLCWCSDIFLRAHLQNTIYSTEWRVFEQMESQKNWNKFHLLSLWFNNKANTIFHQHDCRITNCPR